MSRPWQRPRAPEPPVFWEHFCLEWLTLSRPQMQRWWSAVCRSSWVRPVTLRGTIRAHEVIDTQTAQVVHLYRDLLTPRALLEVLDDVTHQRLLTYREAGSFSFRRWGCTTGSKQVKGFCSTWGAACLARPA